MGEQVITHILQCSLSDIDHNTVPRIGCSHTDCIEASYPGNSHGKRFKIRHLLRQHRRNIIINQFLDKHGPLYIGEHTDKNQDCYQNQMRCVILCHIPHQSLKNLTRIFYFLTIRRHFASHSRTRHYSSPAFSSKSPLPPVCDS